MTTPMNRYWPSLFAWLALGAAPIDAAPLAGGFKHSGWYQFEVVVMIDTRAETLESETWPLLPTVGYPARWRWLQDENTRMALAAAHPDAVVASSPSGHMTVRLPAPPPRRWEASPDLLTEGDMRLIDELIKISQGTETSSLAPTETTAQDASDEPAVLTPGPLLPFEDIAPPEAETPSLLALDSLGMAEAAPQTDSPAVNIPFARPVEAVTLKPVIVTVRPIPTPAPFVQLPLDQLEAGLTRYRRNSEDEVVASVSWLQGPDSETLPILLETDSDTGYPPLQGFIQLIPRNNSWRMGINFWANTDARYLPEIFEMSGPPPSPQRITFLEPEIAVNVDMDGETESSSDANAVALEEQAFTWREIMTQATTPAPAPSSDPFDERSAPPTRPEWPWRHLIQVADTIPLTENRLRYYDHPVIKVLAVWRELSWYELFYRGKILLDASPVAPVSAESAIHTLPAISGAPAPQD